jgi:hypothetical protein
MNLCEKNGVWANVYKGFDSFQKDAVFRGAQKLFVLQTFSANRSIRPRCSQARLASARKCGRDFCFLPWVGPPTGQPRALLRNLVEVLRSEQGGLELRIYRRANASCMFLRHPIRANYHGFQRCTSNHCHPAPQPQSGLRNKAQRLRRPRRYPGKKFKKSPSLSRNARRACEHRFRPGSGRESLNGFGGNR